MKTTPITALYSCLVMNFLTRHKKTWNKEKYANIVYRTLFYCWGSKAQELRLAIWTQTVWIQTWFCHSWARWPWASSLAMCPSLLIYKARRITAPACMLDCTTAPGLGWESHFEEPPPTLYISGLFLSKEKLQEICREEMK